MCPESCSLLTPILAATPPSDSLFIPSLHPTLLDMDTLYHREEHFEGGDTVKDIVIGMSDGLTGMAVS